jgi:23S rRNA (adenine2503-C2)-methyltransferase
MMEIAARVGDDDIAVVYVGQFDDGELVEFVEAVQPPLPRETKWVLMLSTLYGCPVECKMCDAGGFYHGKISKERLLAQLDYMVHRHYPAGVIPCKQFKIQFARMGEPSFNPAVLETLKELPGRYQARGLMPSLSTIAPRGVDKFFDDLLEIKNELYPNGQFQFQFSMHTSDETLRKQLIPVRTWRFAEMAAYGEQFYRPGDRKITLNFALAKDLPLDPEHLRPYFDPQKFLIKITPLNPTYQAESNGLDSFIDTGTGEMSGQVVEALEDAGYRVIVSVGELEENRIGSNCGQYVLKHVLAESKLGDGYLYKIEHFINEGEHA